MGGNTGLTSQFWCHGCLSEFWFVASPKSCQINHKQAKNTAKVCRASNFMYLCMLKMKANKQTCNSKTKQRRRRKRRKKRREREREGGGERERKGGGGARERERERERQTDRQTDRQTETDRQRQRESERERERERERVYTGFCLDIHTSISPKSSMIIGTTKVYILIPIWMTLTFTEDHRCTRKQNFLLLSSHRFLNKF